MAEGGGGAAGTIGEAFVEIRPELTRFFSEMSSGLKSAAEGAVNANSSSMDKLAEVGKIATAALAAGFAVVAVAAVKAADTFEVAHAQLEVAVKNTGGSMEELQGKVKGLESEFEKYGYTNAQTETALTKLVQATHDPKLAITDLGVAANIAAGRHMDLGAASQLLSRVLQGNYGVLVRLGVATRDQVKNITSQQQAIDLLNKTYGGAASAAADTFAGKEAALKARVEDLEKSIGLALIPVLEDLFTALGEGIDFFEKNRAAAVALGIVIGGPLAAAMAAFIAQEAVLIGSKVLEFWTSLGEFAAKSALAIAAAADTVYAALGPFGLLAAGAAVLAVAFSKSGNAAAKAGDAFAQSFIDSAKRSADEVQILQRRISDLAQEQQNLILSETKQLDFHHQVNLSLHDMAKSYLNTGAGAKDLEGQFKRNQAEIKNYQGELKKLDDAHKSDTEAMKAAKEAGVPLADQQETLSTSAADLAKQYGSTADVIDALATKMKVDLTKATQEQIDALGEQATRLGETSAQALGLQDAMAKLADKTSDATAKAQAFKTALDALIGKNIDAEKAVVEFQGKIDGLSKKLHDNKDSFDAQTQAGRDNITMVEDAVTAIRNHIEALQNQGASADALRGAFDGDTGALQRQLTQAGLTKGQIDQLIKSYGLVPENIETVIDADLSPAEAGLRQFKQDLANVMAGATVKIPGAPIGAPRFAAGGYTGDHGPFVGILDPHEVVVPLDDPGAAKRALSQIPSRYLSSGGGSIASVGSGGPSYVFHNTFNVPAGVNPDDYARAMAPALTVANRELLHLMRSGVGVRS